jgi:predicted AAA+ superfamily ATPase
MKIQFELIDGFGLALSWHECEQHNFAIIIMFFAIKFKRNK